MTQITNITDDGDQQIVLLLPNGQQATMELRYAGAGQFWFMNLTYNNKNYNGVVIRTSPNILRPWKNTLPFGLAFTTTDMATDPFDVKDFSTGRASCYLLSPQDIAFVESSIIGAAA